MENLPDFKNFCKHLADESGKIIKEYFRTNLKIEKKSDETPVTIADKKAEEKMRELIMKEFPEHGILGEEFGLYNEYAEYRWVIDPIDGTKSFVCGTVAFGTLIALVKDKEPILGVINQPVLDEFLIGDSISTELNGEKVSVRESNNLNDAVLLTSDHFNIGNYFSQKNFDTLAEKVKLYRNWGDCYGYYLVATGYADIMIDPIMNEWDLISLIPIIKGSGGIITDYYGNDPLESDSIVAATQELHSEVIKILNKF